MNARKKNFEFVHMGKKMFLSLGITQVVAAYHNHHRGFIREGLDALIRGERWDGAVQHYLKRTIGRRKKIG